MVPPRIGVLEASSKSAGFRQPTEPAGPSTVPSRATSPASPSSGFRRAPRRRSRKVQANLVARGAAPALSPAPDRPHPPGRRGNRQGEALHSGCRRVYRSPGRRAQPAAAAPSRPSPGPPAAALLPADPRASGAAACSHSPSRPLPSLPVVT